MLVSRHTFFQEGAVLAKKRVFSKESAAAFGAASQAVYLCLADAKGLVFISGQLPIHPETGQIPDGIKAQTERALCNVEAVLRAAGTNFSRVMEITVFLASLQLVEEFEEVYRSFLAGWGVDGERVAFPARTMVKGLPADDRALLMIKATAYVK